MRRQAGELAPEQARCALGLRAMRRRRSLLETASGTSVTALRLVIGLVTSLVTSGTRVALRLESLFSVGGSLPGVAAVSLSSVVSVGIAAVGAVGIAAVGAVGAVGESRVK